MCARTPITTGDDGDPAGQVVHAVELVRSIRSLGPWLRRPTQESNRVSLRYARGVARAFRAGRDWLPLA